MKKHFLLLLLFFATSLSAAPDGAALYDQHCSVCHGDEGQGGIGVPLSIASFIDKADDEFIRTSIREGREGRIMPAFKTLGDAQVEAIVKHIRKWGTKPAPRRDESRIAGNIEAGEVLYQKHCLKCHGANGEGGEGTGVTFSRPREYRIMAPALNNPGFLKAATDHFIKRIILEGRDETPMSSFRDKGLTDKQVNDLVAYIRDFENRPLGVVDYAYEDNVITIESPHDMKTTIKLIEQAVVGHNFTHIRTQFLEDGFVKPGTENKKQAIIYFCNFTFMLKALNIDPRAGLFLPCRVTVVEREGGQVELLVANPKRWTKLFNNRLIKGACEEMHAVYENILDDSTL